MPVTADSAGVVSATCECVSFVTDAATITTSAADGAIRDDVVGVAATASSGAAVTAPHVVAGVTSTFSCTSFSTSTSTSATPSPTATPNTIATTTADVAIIADGGAVGSAVFVAAAVATAETGTCSYTVSFYSNYLCESFFCVFGSSLDS